jgi:hypothetical protein
MATDYFAIALELQRKIDEHPEERLRIIQKTYAEMVEAGDLEGAKYVMLLRTMIMADRNNQSNQHPKWLQPVGIGIGLLTLLFFMGIVLLGIAGFVVPPQTKYALVSVLALGAAFASAAWIGNMVLSGDIASPNSQRPLVISAAGGFAVFIVVFALGYALYIR